MHFGSHAAAGVTYTPVASGIGARARARVGAGVSAGVACGGPDAVIPAEVIMDALVMVVAHEKC